MEYKLYLMTANGWKMNGVLDIDNLLNILDTIAEEDIEQQVIVIQHDNKNDIDDVFYMTPRTKEQYYEWRAFIDNAKNKEKVMQIIK